jgi:hypothetical protein
MSSRQPRLRAAAADTLRHLAERDVQSVLEDRIESQLFAALDSETDAAVSAQISATLRTLLEVGAASEPMRWMGMCAEVVTAAAPSGAGATPGTQDGGKGGQGVLDACL